MAHTARSEKETREYFDPPEVLDDKITQLARLIQSSKYFIAFTGAGISTTCGISDFRSGMNTVLKTGAGAWTLRAELEKGNRSSVSKMEENTKRFKTSTLSAIPSRAHMALVELNRKGILKHLVSQNTDGLHRRSGFDIQCLSELHGNSNLERCARCGKEYMSDYRTRTAQRVHSHETGRVCSVSGCNGPLMDTIINFGESLPVKALTRSFEEAEKADLCLSLGSSLTVSPANEIPEIVAKKRHGHLVIVNLQSTPLDDICDLRIYALLDEVVARVMEKLDLQIPKFKLKRRCAIQHKWMESSGGRKLEIIVSSVDVDGTVMSLFRSVEMSKHAELVGESKSEREPHRFRYTLKSNKAVDVEKLNMGVTLEFMGHYREPSLTLQYPLSTKQPYLYEMLFDPSNGEWTTELLSPKLSQKPVGIASSAESSAFSSVHSHSSACATSSQESAPDSSPPAS